MSKQWSCQDDCKRALSWPLQRLVTQILWDAENIRTGLDVDEGDVEYLLGWLPRDLALIVIDGAIAECDEDAVVYRPAVPATLKRWRAIVFRGSLQVVRSS